MDKEGEIYQKMVLLPDISKDAASKTSKEEQHKETMLFKASAVKLSSFIAKRVSDRQEESERIKRMYREQFGEGGGVKINQSKSSLKDSNQIMIMDASTLLLDGSKNSIFISSTDEEEQRT